MHNQKIQLNIAICDDAAGIPEKLESLCRRILEDRYLLRFITAQDPQVLLDANEVFDIALLDVVLVANSGIRLAEEILKRNAGCRILFISEYTRVVSDVYDVPHFCFILKDQLECKLPKFLTRASELCAQEAGKELCVKTRNGIQSIPLSQILVLERRGHWTYITLWDGEMVETREKLSELSNRICSAYFIRCHISYIVNLQHVRLLENRTLFLENHTQIPVSLPHEQEVEDAFFSCLSK